jgi:hypothetical protein
LVEETKIMSIGIIGLGRLGSLPEIYEKMLKAMKKW